MPQIGQAQWLRFVSGTGKSFCSPGIKGDQIRKEKLLEEFLSSRREGISPRTVKFYADLLTPFVEDYPLTTEGIRKFLANLTCHNGKHAYFRAIRAFCNWAVREGHLKKNPVKRVDAPKPAKQILPSLTAEQVDYLIEQVEDLRDKAIISLFADSGIRLNELAMIRARDIDWKNSTVSVWGKGNKQRRAPFTERTAGLLRQLLRNNRDRINVWNLKPWGIVSFLRRLEAKTGLPCNPHTFRRTFASNLHRAGLDIEHIMRLGGWESLEMVLRYTRSVKFEDSLKQYKSYSKTSVLGGRDLKRK